MKQICPRCREWFDINTRFCPSCDVGLYTEEEYSFVTRNEKPAKILSHRRINRMYNYGAVQIVLGISLIIVGIIFIASYESLCDFFQIYIELNETLSELTTYIVILAGILGGITLFSLGIKFISTYNYFTKEFKETPHIQCPYCKSYNVTRLTTFDRASSVIAVGTASGKLGKQWHCNNCTSDF